MVSRYSKEYSRLLDRLKQARREADLTQRQVADRHQPPQSKVSRIESGETKIDPVDLGLFCRLYKKPPTYFVPTLR